MGDVYRSTSPLPVPRLEDGAAWLHANAPQLGRVSLVHGVRTDRLVIA